MQVQAIGYPQAGPITADNALVTFETTLPEPGPHDLLVAVQAVSVNPVDVKVRAGMAVAETPRILGWDAAGVVQAVGAQVMRFQPGDEVFYAGDLMRPGSNATHQLVDERLVGRKPTALNFAEAAALPLTAITAWEILFDCFGLREGEGDGQALLVVGGAGGVGSILIQLAKQLTGLTVIASASRPETQAWVTRMGADHVVDHRRPLDEVVAELGIQPRYVAALTHTDRHFEALVNLIQPRGHLALIDDPADLQVSLIKRKALTLSWEFMFTRSMFQTEDMAVQHDLLNRVAALVDQGALVSTLNHHGGALTLANLRAAHVLQESGNAIGKTVLDGMPG